MLVGNPRIKLSIRELRLAKLGANKGARGLCQREFEAYLSAMAAMGEQSVPSNLITNLDNCLKKGRVSFIALIFHCLDFFVAKIYKRSTFASYLKVR